MKQHTSLRLPAGFTLIELMIVIGIISILFVAGVLSYSQFLKTSRDAARKADIANIQGALEIYKSNNSNSYPLTLSSLVPNYMGNIADPLTSQGYSYQYQPLNGGANCAVTPCNDYVVGALLEASSATCTTAPANKCKGTTNCNYCIGPVGAK